MLGNAVNAVLFAALGIFDFWIWTFKVLLPLVAR